MKKFAFLLLLILLGLGAVGSSGCARRTSLNKKTKWYKKHHKPGGRIPCPTHDC